MARQNKLRKKKISKIEKLIYVSIQIDPYMLRVDVIIVTANISANLCAQIVLIPKSWHTVGKCV